MKNNGLLNKYWETKRMYLINVNECNTKIICRVNLLKLIFSNNNKGLLTKIIISNRNGLD